MMKKALLLLAMLASCKERPEVDMIDGSIAFQVDGMRRINGAL